MFEFIAAGSILFWIILLGFFMAMAFYSENDGFNATIALVLAFTFVQLIGRYDIYHVIISNFNLIPTYAIWYVGIGILFAIIKWITYVYKQRGIYNFLREEFIVNKLLLKRDTIVNFNFDQKQDFKEFLSERYRANKDRNWGSDNHIIPDIRQNKATLVRWMMWWPLNAIYTFFNDPVRIFFNWVYDTLSGMLQAVSNAAFKGTEQDHLTDEEQKLLTRHRRG